MTRTEFITRASAMGYCTKAQAKAYAGDRTKFTDADFEEVYRYAERQEYLRKLDEGRQANAHGSHPIPGGGRTTKRYTTYNSHGGGSA